MEISSTSGVGGGYASAMTGTKAATDVGVAMLNKALDTQAESAEQMIQSVTETSSTSSLPEHLGRNINVTA